MNKIQKIKISDLGKVITGKTPSSACPGDFNGEFLFVTPPDFTAEKHIYKSERTISNKGALKLQNKILQKDSAMVTCIGDIGRVAMTTQQTITNQQINAILVNTKKYHPDYIYYLFKNSKKYFTNNSGQTVLSILGKTEFEKIELPVLEDKAAHTKISNVLSLLDSKIELNNKINTKLEALVKLLYDYWFVQFNFPNDNGKPYKSSGGKMIWNADLKRDIPKGWEHGTLLNIADYINGLPCQKFRPTEKEFLRVIKIREMHEGFSADTELVSPNIPHDRIIENGDVLFSWSASLEVQIWAGGRGALNQHIFKVVSDKYPKSFYYFQLLNYLNHFKMMAANRKTTMGHITQEHLEQSRIALPPVELTLKLESILSPILEKKVKNEIESQQLRELRDWLLPMLMNGQVKVK